MPRHADAQCASPRIPTLTALALLVGLSCLGSGCVSTAHVPREDVRAAEQDYLATAVESVMLEEGLELAVVEDAGRHLESTWQPVEDGASTRRRVRVRITDTSMGVALRTRIVYAVPAPDGLDAHPDAELVEIDGTLWRVDDARRPQAKEEEASLGQAIQLRWRQLRARGASALGSRRPTEGGSPESDEAPVVPSPRHAPLPSG